MFKHAVNMGKGRALKTAFDYILNELPDKEIVITVDADGQYTKTAVEKVYHANFLVNKKKVFESNGRNVPRQLDIFC